MQEALENYLRQILGMVAELESVTIPKGLPVLYRATFQLLKGTLENSSCIFAVDREKTHLTPARIKKHIAVLADCFHLPVAYVGSLSNAHEPERLIAMRVPFIVPGRHMYLPFIGTVFRPVKKNVPIERDYICCCAQLILTGVLLKQIALPVRIAEAVAKLPFSRSAVISALDELEHFNLGRKEKPKNGHEVVFRFNHTGHSLWEESHPFLRNPCKRTVGLSALPENFVPVTAGADALAEVSMLSEMPPSIFAMELSRFRKMELETLPVCVAEIKLQLWLYPPCLFGTTKIDPLSLALSLRNDPDDRVQIALDEYMKGFPW